MVGPPSFRSWHASFLRRASQQSSTASAWPTCAYPKSGGGTETPNEGLLGSVEVWYPGPRLDYLTNAFAEPGHEVGAIVRSPSVALRVLAGAAPIEGYVTILKKV